MAEDIITINVTQKVDSIQIYITPVSESISIAVQEGGFGKVDSVNGKTGMVSIPSVIIGTGSPPSPAGLIDGTQFLKYTP
jgi:hypothetical protein